MRIIIQTIPHDKQRYPTVGDWIFLENGDLSINISDMGNDDYTLMVGLHEAIEAWLCRKREISEESVTKFDTSEYGLSLEDPGSDPKAPYHKEHMFCLEIEKQLGEQLGVNWKEYEDKLGEICPT